METRAPVLPRSSLPWSQWAWPLAVFALLSTLTAMWWQHRRESLETDRTDAFHHEIARATFQLRERLDTHAQFLRAVGALFAASEEVTPREWEDFARHAGVEHHLPGLLAYGFSPRVEAGDVPAFEARVRRQTGDSRFRVFPSPGSGAAFPVQYLHAVSDETTVQRAQGFDIHSQAVRRQAIDQAGDTDEVVISGPIILVFDQDSRRPGFLMLRAVYRPRRPTRTVAERQAAFAGVAYAAYRMAEFIQPLAQTLPLQLAFRIHDEDEAAQPFLLHASHAAQEDAVVSRLGQHDLDFGQRTWHLDFATLGPEGGGGPDEPDLILAGGLAISALLSLAMLALTTHRQRADAYAAQVTADLRAAEAGIRARDRFKQEILDAATEVAIIATDAGGTITLFNRGAEKMLGYRAGEMIGHHSLAAVHDAADIAGRESVLAAQVGRPLAGAEVFTVLPELFGRERREWTYICREGRRLRVDQAVTAQRDSDGCLTGFLAIAVDVTDRREAEARLRHQHEVLQTILDHLSSGISLVDRDLNFIAANRQLREVLDFPAELFAGRNPTFREVALFNARRGEYGPGDPDALADALVAKATHPEPHRFQRTRPNGRVIEVEGNPLPAGGFVTIYTDITERREAEEELRRHRDHLQELVDERTADLEAALREASAANRAKSDFLANMSHELRTPMHAILSFSRLGLERSTRTGADKLSLYFERIRTSAERLLGLIDGLLDLSRLEAGRMPLHSVRFDVLPLVEGAVAHLESLLLSRRLTVRIDGRDGCWLLGDAGQIERVIHNLLSNAIKYSEDGGEIAIAVADSSLGGAPALTVAFSDRGVGIPPGELDHIFEKFVQSSTTNTGAGGTGLGLAICREIVAAHHGTIAAANNPQGGATFTVCLPAPPVPV